MRIIITILYITIALWGGSEYTIFGFLIYVPLIIIIGKFEVNEARNTLIKLEPKLELLMAEYKRRGYDSASHQIDDFINGTKRVLGFGVRVLPVFLFSSGGNGLEKLGADVAGQAFDKAGESISESVRIKSLDRESLKEEINKLKDSIAKAKHTINDTELNASLIVITVIILVFLGIITFR